MHVAATLVVAAQTRQMRPSIAIAIVAGIAVVILIGILIARRFERLRTEALQQRGVALGLAFEETGDLDQLRALCDLPLFGHGRGKRAKNVMSGRTDAGDVRVLDYQYTTGGGKSSHTWSQTVALYPGGGRGLPDFGLWPENPIFRALGKMLRWQDINFEADAVFSSNYILRGPDEAAIRAAFTAEMLSFFGQHKGWTVEVQSGNVGIYRSEQRVKPEALGQFLEETAGVLRSLERA